VQESRKADKSTTATSDPIYGKFATCSRHRCHSGRPDDGNEGRGAGCNLTSGTGRRHLRRCQNRIPTPSRLLRSLPGTAVPDPTTGTATTRQRKCIQGGLASDL